jgi:hypothetical protein
MSKLEHLSFRSCFFSEVVAFGELLLSTRTLRLKSFTLDLISLTEENQIKLCEVLEFWNCLERLELEDLSNWMPGMLLRLMASFAHFEAMKVLKLTGMNVVDSVMPALCTAIDKMPHMNTLSLAKNDITCSGLDELCTCLQQRPTQLQKLLVAGNSGARNADVVRRLEEVSLSVISKSAL